MRLPRWDVALYFWGEKRGTGSVTGLNDNKPSSFLTQHLFSLPGECAAPLMCVRLCQQKKDLVAGDASDSCPFIFYWVNLNVLQDAHGDKAGMHTSADRNASIVHVHLYMNTYRCTCTRSPTPSPRGGHSGQVAGISQSGHRETVSCSPDLHVSPHQTLPSPPLGGAWKISGFCRWDDKATCAWAMGGATTRRPVTYSSNVAPLILFGGGGLMKKKEREANMHSVT